MLSLRSAGFGLLRAITLRATLAVAVAAGLVAASRPAQAAPMDKRELEARADFAAGRYQKAVDTFAQLFADTGDPLYLRNIGRCYQKMKRAQEAIDAFQEYLLKGRNLSKSERQEIQGYIKEMQALKASETPPTPPAPAIVPPAPSAPLPSPGAPPPADGTGAPPAAKMPPFEPLAPPPPGALGAPPPAGDGRSFRIAGIASAAGGVALIAVGIGFGAAAQSAADDVGKKYNSSTDSAGKRDATLQWVGYGVGAAAVATGVLLYLHGRQPDTEHASRLHGVARLDGHAGAVLLEGAF